jgi:Flp pilus assembly protein TadG
MNRASPARNRAEEGAAAVEAGLIISVLLLLVIGSAELGRAFWTHNAMLLAVEEAGRYAMVHNHRLSGTCRAQSAAPPCPAPSDTPLANCSALRAQQVLSDYQLRNIEVSVREDTTGSPTTLTICASSYFTFIAPGLLPYGPPSLISRVTVPLM